MFLLFLTLILSDAFQINEVGGKFLISAQTVYGRTYLYFQQSATTFDIYYTDWETDEDRPTFHLVPKDQRIRQLILSNLVPTKDGLCIVSIGNRIIYELDKGGKFLRKIDLRDHLPIKERPYNAFPTKSGRILLTTKDDEYMVLYEFDTVSKALEKRHTLPEPGSFHVLPTESGYFQIAHDTGEIIQLDESYNLVYAKSALFEVPDQTVKSLIPSLRKKDSQLLRFPIYGANQLTMLYQANIKGQKLRAAARFNGEQFVFSKVRPLAKSPSGSKLLVFDFEDEELRLVPVTFKNSETRIPPIPGG